MPDPISAGVGALSTGLGIFGAKKASDAQKKSADAQLFLTRVNQEQLQKEQNRASNVWDRYAREGSYGLGQLSNFDLMKGVGDQPSYDKEYWDRLDQYESSPAFQAQNQLGQLDLAHQQAARGIRRSASSANASAELSQKLRATDYDKYRQDLAARYAALQGEYGQRRDLNKDQYQQIMDRVKIGTGALQQQQASNLAYNQAKSGNVANASNAINQQGQANAGFWSGLGGTLGGGLMAGQAAKGLGAGSWFGGNAAAAAQQTPYATNPSGLATMGPWATGIGGQ